jgi:UDP-N-acetylglucosamine 2-epimerase (non-hydrolysing)
MLAFDPVLRQQQPDLVLVVGDVNSTVACTLTAAKRHIPVAHVEAGLRSFDRTMPEEVNRVVTDALADWLFTTERGAVENLLREGLPRDKIYFVGNVMIDTLLRHRERALQMPVLERFDVRPGDYVLVTLHRPRNVDDAPKLAAIVEALGQVRERLPVIFSVHPRTRKRLKDFGLLTRVTELLGKGLCEPLGYLEFLHLTARARVVLTDSGGIQEETTILGVPCVTLRPATERPVTVAVGTNRVIGSAPERVVPEIERILAGDVPEGRVPDLWDGRAAERIVEVLVGR